MTSLASALVAYASARVTVEVPKRVQSQTILSLADKNKPEAVSDTVFTDQTPNEPSSGNILTTAISGESGTSATAFGGLNNFTADYLGQLLDITL